jgi:hypothetical protein
VIGDAGRSAGVAGVHAAVCAKCDAEEGLMRELEHGLSSSK